MIDLPGVTLCAIDHAAHDLTRLALERCLKHVNFGDVLVLSDKEILPGARHMRTQCKDFHEAQILLLKVLPYRVVTPRFLYVQWDSWIINPDAWTDDFLEYDYIGAPWPERWIWPGCDPSHNVGNGGFSLRSVELMKTATQNHDIYSPEDHAICVEYRPELEMAGFKWAPHDVAQRFAVEGAPWPESKPFGFHGAFHFISALTPDEYDEVERLASPYVRESKPWANLQQIIKYLGTTESQYDETAEHWRKRMHPDWIERLEAA